MSTSIIRFRSILICLLIFTIVSCSSSSPVGEPTLTPDVIGKSSPNPDITVGTTPGDLEKEPTKQLQPTAQIQQGPVIAPTVDINNTNINLMEELYFIGGAEQGDSLSVCPRSLFMEYDVSLQSEREFITNNTTPPELKQAKISPYFWGSVESIEGAIHTLYLCIYAFPENENIKVEFYTPEGDLCASWEVNISDYYYSKIGDITIVDFAGDWPLCSRAGQWSVVVKSASVSLTKPIRVGYYDTFSLGASSACDSTNAYVSVQGTGYPPGEPRLLGVYGSSDTYVDDFTTVYELLQAYQIEIDKEGSFDVLLPMNHQGSRIVVPVMADKPPGGGYLGNPEPAAFAGITGYPQACENQDVNLATPTLKGEDVKVIQQRLRELGYFEVGPVDGNFGNKTETAVRLFQQTNSLNTNGIMDETTRSVLFGENATPRPHERNLYVTSPRLNGDDVLIVQQRLTDLGYREVGEVDGYYGPMTESGVLRFQKMNRLPESGIVDEQTWNAIFGSNPVPGW